MSRRAGAAGKSNGDRSVRFERSGDRVEKTDLGFEIGTSVPGQVDRFSDSDEQESHVEPVEMYDTKRKLREDEWTDAPGNKRIAASAGDRNSGGAAQTSTEVQKLAEKLQKLEETLKDYKEFAHSVVADCPPVLHKVEIPKGLWENKNFVLAVMKADESHALKQADEAIKKEIRNEMRGFCIFCNKPVLLRDDPNGSRGSQQFPKADGTSMKRYFHTACNTQENCNALGVEYKQPLKCSTCQGGLCGREGTLWYKHSISGLHYHIKCPLNP
jgi:hypothetical protein